MRILDMLLAVLVTAIWGGNFVSAKIGLTHFPPFMLTGLRFAFVAMILLPFVPRPTRRQMIGLAKLALALGTLHIGLLFAALALGLDIASTVILGELGVPFACLLGAILLHDHLGRWRIGGMVIAFLGIAIITGTPNIQAHMAAASIAVGSAFAWAVANIILKRQDSMPIFQWLAWFSLFTVLPLMLISAIFEQGQWQLLQTTPLLIAFSIVYSILGSTITAYGLWYYLLQKHPVSQITPFALLTPVFGIIFAQLWFHEALTWQIIIGGSVAITGVAIIVIRRPKMLIQGEAV